MAAATNPVVASAFAYRLEEAYGSANFRYYPASKDGDCAGAYSYSMSIACWIGGTAYLRDTHYSRTTSSHINALKWALFSRGITYQLLPPDYYDRLLSALETTNQALHARYERIP
jgi:hypothetical protein